MHSSQWPKMQLRVLLITYNLRQLRKFGIETKQEIGRVTSKLSLKTERH